MRTKILLSLLVVVLIAAFAYSNRYPVPLHFLFWDDIVQVSVLYVIVVAYLLGVLTAAMVAAWVRRRRERKAAPVVMA